MREKERSVDKREKDIMINVKKRGIGVAPPVLTRSHFFHRLRVRYHLYKVQVFLKNPFSFEIVVAWDYFELSEYFK